MNKDIQVPDDSRTRYPQSIAVVGLERHINAFAYRMGADEDYGYFKEQVEDALKRGEKVPTLRLKRAFKTNKNTILKWTVFYMGEHHPELELQGGKWVKS